MIVITTMSGKAILTCRPNSHLFQDRSLMLDQPVKIGRSVARARPSPSNAIFDCKVLSRNHALFWFANGKFYLQDTKSSNGTFVNNQRLSKSGEESLPREVCSGDIVQFGVDVIENTRKVTHGCIVANLKLFLPDGKEAIASHSTSSLSSNTIPIEELYELHQYLQEAMQREHTLETKLIALQEILNTIKDAADQGWKSLIAEDRLLTRVEALENQLQTYTKNFGEDKLKEELVKLQEDKNHYQCTAKDFLKKILDEKLEVVQKCQEIKRTLVNVEAAYACLMEDMEKSHMSIQDLTHKLSLQLSRNEEAELKIQELERKHKETVERLETRNKELEKIVAMRHAAEETLEKQLTDLRTAENIANDKASSFELQLKTLNSVLGENEYSSLKMDEDNGKEDDYLRLKICLEKEKKSKEVLDLISAQLDLLQDEKMSRLQQISQLEDDYEAYCQKKSDYGEEHSEIQSKLDLLESRIREVGQDSSECDVTLTPKIGNGKTAVNGSADSIDLIQTQMRDLKGVYSEVGKFMDNCEMNIVALKADIDRAKNNLIKTTGHCIIAQEKLEKAHENYEECHLISQVLKERVKMHQFNNEDLPDDENSLNKKNQEQEENILRRQLVEAQHVAKQSRNEQAQLLDKISALTAEIESRNGPDDNKIQEKLMETQQECHRFQNTISLLQSEILSLNEQCSHLREEKRLIERKLENCKIQGISTTEAGKQDDDILLKVSRLEEELVMFGSKYMKCNEERSALSRELANLRLDYEAILHQPYFNLIFAFPCIVLIVAFIVMFYPSLSQIMGTAEHTDKNASG